MEGDRSEREGGGLRRVARRGAIVLAWLALWQLAALAVGNALLLCGPAEAAAALARNLADPAFWTATARSFERIALGFAAACALGLAAGAAAARWASVRDFLAPLLHVVKSTPVVCVIALLLVGAGANRATSLVVGLVVAPPFYFAALEARGARDRALDEMLAVFSVPRLRRWTCVRWPEAAPFLRAAAKTAAGMAWKAGVAAEIIGLPAASIGEQVYLAKLTLDTPAIIAWTAAVVVLGWLSERAVVALVDAGARLPQRWLARRVRQAEAAMPAAAAAAAPAAAEPASAASAEAACAAEGASLPWPAPAELSFEDVAKGFDGNTVIEGFTLEVPPGGRAALMAPSGSGKTTLLRLACALDHHDYGVLGRTPHVSAMLQEARLIEGLTAPENLALTARTAPELTYGLSLLAQLLEGAPEALAKPVSQLSGGMRRRVELARALAHPSAVLLLDEPFTGLDAATRERTALLAEAHLHGRTLLMATHDEADAALMGAQVVAFR